MKKMFITLLFAATFFNVKAEKLPYVSVTKTPAASEHIANLKLAIQGKKIPGAVTNCDADDYKKAWGDALYQRVLDADPDEFVIGVTVGGEQNWGIDKATGTASATATALPAGVQSIWLGDIEIAKIGTNYCYNALTPYKKASPGNKTGGGNLNPNPGSGNVNPNGINITVGQQGGQELSWSAGYTVYSQGRNDRTNDILADFTVFKMAQDAKECCGGGQQQLVASNAIPVAGASNVSMMQVPTGFQQAKPRFVETFFGQVAVNTIGTAGGILLVRGLDNLMYRLMHRGGNYYYAPSGDGYNPGTGGPVQGGFGSAGFITGGGTVLSYNGATPVQGAGFQWGN